MRGLIKCGLAAVMVVATAIPAMARTWDVCVAATDMNVSSETASGLPLFFSAVTNVFPNGTFHEGTSGSPINDCSTGATPIGTFFAKGSLVANLPTETSGTLTDVYFVDWQFRINGKGQVVTSGPSPLQSANPGTTFVQIITGASGGLGAATGKASVLVLSSAGDKFGDKVNSFRITVP